MGVPSQPSVALLLDSVIGLPRDLVFDSSQYWVVDAVDKIVYALDTLLNCVETEDIDLTARTNNPIAIAWTGHQPVVYDLGTSENKLLFFGTEPESVSIP